MIQAKVVNDDGFEITFRREKATSVLPIGMIVNIPEPWIDFNIIHASIKKENNAKPPTP